MIRESFDEVQTAEEHPTFHRVSLAPFPPSNCQTVLSVLN